MPRPAIGNTIDINGLNGDESPIIKIPNGEPIILRSKGFDIKLADDVIQIINRRTKSAMMTFTDREIIIGNPSGEHIKFKQ